MAQDARGEVTRLLHRWGDGHIEASRELWALIHGELRRLAGYYFQREERGHPLQPTAVVHEVYLKLLDQKKVEWRDRVHFMGACAVLIRRVLVDQARAAKADKRGGGATLVSMSEANATTDQPAFEILDLHRALEKLSEFDSRQERIVESRFFGGLTIEETAEVLKISPATVKREWRTAKAWLYRELG